MNCSFSGCESVAKKRGWCSRHYLRWWRNGDPSIVKRAMSGDGFLQDGYPAKRINGRMVFDHVAIAEKALGRPLPTKVEIHHVDSNRENNLPENLVICPSHSYHMFLHSRTKALNATGNTNQRKCSICKRYDLPENLRFYKVGKSIQARHSICINAYNKENSQRRRLSTSSSI